MREQGQISTRSLPHRLSSSCCGSETAQNATWLRYQGGKRQVNVRRTACEQAVIPFASGDSWRTQGEQTKELFFHPNSPIPRQRWADGARGWRDGDTAAAIQSGKQVR